MGIFESAFANLCFGSFFSMWVAVPSVWVRQHVILHHVHTNHHTRDPDLHHFDHVIPMYRLTAGTSWKNAYGAWRYTMPIITLNTGLFLLLVEAPGAHQEDVPFCPHGTVLFQERVGAGLDAIHGVFLGDELGHLALQHVQGASPVVCLRQYLLCLLTDLARERILCRREQRHFNGVGSGTDTFIEGGLPAQELSVDVPLHWSERASGAPLVSKRALDPLSTHLRRRPAG